MNLLEHSLANDTYHQDTTPSFFLQPGTACNVYEDDHGPVCFVRGAKALRLDIQWVANEDFKRNLRVMLKGFPLLEKQARENGFTEIIFNTTNPLLSTFCRKHLGFSESSGELRKLI